jgi:hypothetical protein
MLDHLIDRRYPHPERWTALATRLAYFAAGVGAVVVPVLGTFVLVAGFEPVYAALVRFPLENYRTALHQHWGTVGLMAFVYAGYSFPAVLRYSPVALVLPAAECVTDLLRGVDRQRVRALTTLIILSGFFALSIMYYPGVIHIAFIAVGFWLCAAMALGGSSCIRPALIGRVAGALLAALVSAAHCAPGAVCPYPPAPVSGRARDRIGASPSHRRRHCCRGRARAPGTPASGELFCYILAAPYLTTGVSPTPYQPSASISPYRHIQERCRSRERASVRHCAHSHVKADDPVVQYIWRHYEPVDLSENSGGSWYRCSRKDRARLPSPLGS